MDVDVEEIDEAWKEEEQLVVVHLSGIIDTDYLKKCDPSNCKILGIDTDEPAMQIDQMVFTGNYKESIGSNIIFEEQESTAADGELLTDFKYMSHTTKTLEMNRVFLKGIQTESRDTNSEFYCLP
ncbi:general transcription factor 3C polypeptide 6-like isoform X2 [Xenia sp. Carnegie-2017]|uniref:general transcription factor 3C polypeptide 6-like isoform X2 n=1 Tax=Xenia sp. Carnegie-2017 TaxID=2897299 RepID=UPI001F04C18F|nr:general transcription factor 3C polypeptide 6-like isoform X2 [Xenia sp. Carnegie-2017]